MVHSETMDDTHVRDIKKSSSQLPFKKNGNNDAVDFMGVPNGSRHTGCGNLTHPLRTTQISLDLFRPTACSQPTMANPTQAESQHIHSRWLNRLRWSAVVGQLVTVLSVRYLLDIMLPLYWLLGVIAVEAVVNLVAHSFERRGKGSGTTSTALMMLFDLMVLTTLLGLTGGPYNPFNFLYLVHIALAVVVLPPRWTWTLVAASLISSAALFVVHRPLHMAGDHGHAMDLHLAGMWAAFGVAAFFITLFVGRVTRELRLRRLQLDDARERKLRAEKLASLTTLAAGAAHELATPLSTIALVAKELESAIRKSSQQDFLEDATLIRTEVQRCRHILDQLAADSGQVVGEVQREMSVEKMLEQTLGRLKNDPRLNVNLGKDVANATVQLPLQNLTHALQAVVKNSLQASEKGTRVDVSLQVDEQSLTITIADQGCGMSPAILARAAEPFFTSRETGEGMGLGLFLAHSTAETLGGRLNLESSPGNGTVATFTLPRISNAQ
jgi:two-component system, sensor histidine kinase RegB